MRLIQTAFKNLQGKVGLVRNGGRVRIETPHYTDFSSFCDPTHRWHLNTFSFRYFGDDHAGFGYYSRCRFRQVSLRVKLLAFWRWLGFEFLVNQFPRYRRFWEHYLCFVVRGKVMEFEFEALKDHSHDETHLPNRGRIPASGAQAAMDPGPG